MKLFSVFLTVCVALANGAPPSDGSGSSTGPLTGAATTFHNMWLPILGRIENAMGVGGGGLLSRFIPGGNGNNANGVPGAGMMGQLGLSSGGGENGGSGILGRLSGNNGGGANGGTAMINPFRLNSGGGANGGSGMFGLGGGTGNGESVPTDMISRFTNGMNMGGGMGGNMQLPSMAAGANVPS